jgi:hypothetical protein
MAETSASSAITNITRSYLAEGGETPTPPAAGGMSPMGPPAGTWGPEKPRKVAVVGYTHSNRHAPWDDPSWTLWGLNNLHRWVIDRPGEVTRWAGWFDLHDDATIEADPEHVKWLEAEHPFPVWAWRPRPEWPATVQFDGDGLRRRFATDYFTNSISWMIAQAIETVAWAVGDGAEIGVWGVDMAEGSEYAAQRPSCEYFLGIARGMGIKVTVAESSDLLKTAAPYGNDAMSAGLKAKLDERHEEILERQGQARARLGQLAAERGEIEAGLHQMQGALEMLAYFRGVWINPSHDPTTPRAANDVRAAQEGT